MRRRVAPSDSGAFAEGFSLGIERSHGTPKQRVVRRGEWAEGLQYALRCERSPRVGIVDPFF